jgi:cysteinyl-tRNA synthetase
MPAFIDPPSFPTHGHQALRLAFARDARAPPRAARRRVPVLQLRPDGLRPAHIGNFRTFVINDVLRRLLELEFPGKVKHVRNLTDVDDRTIGQARAEEARWPRSPGNGRSCSTPTAPRSTACAPHVEPTATGHIREQVDMIDVLMRKGNAYRAADGSVYFKISSFPPTAPSPASRSASSR